MNRYHQGILAALCLFMAGANWLGPTTFLGRPIQLATAGLCLVAGVILQIQLMRRGAS